MMTKTPPRQDDVAYVMTHYPRVALSFITNEIDALERMGMRIHPLAMNLPGEADLQSDDAEERQKRTTYLKASPARLLADSLGCFLRHPLRMTGLKFRAIGSAGLDPKLIARRLSHLAQAASAAAYCRRHGIRHLHAQFGLSPATIAWFAAEILNFDRRAPRAGWSFTIHGFHDFVDEAVARLDLKTAHADFIVCVSDFTRSQLFRVSEPRHWPKAHVVRCGVHLSEFAFRLPRPLHSPPRIISVGRLSPEKGQVVLLKACKRLSDRGRDFELVFVGSGPFEPQLRSEAERLQISGQVRFLGELPPEQVRHELSTSDLFCLASFSEGLPVSIMEAMAIGVPVVTTSIAGIPELAVNGETASTVPPANAEALSQALNRMLENEGLRQDLAQAARVRVEQMHDLEANVRKMFELLQLKEERA